MTWKILVPLDGSGMADRAIPWADDLAAALLGDVTLLRILAPKPALPGVTPNGRSEESARLSLQEASKGFRRTRSLTLEVDHGSPGEAIANRARDGYDLVVMVSLIERALHRVCGSVASAVIRESGVPVVVLSPSVALRSPRLPRRVLVPLDASELAAGILPYIAPLARQLHCLVVLLAVISPGQSGPGASREMGEYLRRAGAQLGRQQVAVRTVVRAGPPGPVILEFARDAGADLIAMSTRSQRGLDRLRLGSVTEYVLARAATPVLAVHPLAVELQAPHDAIPENRAQGDLTDGALAHRR